MNSIQIENCQKFYAIAQSRLAGDTSGHSLDHVLRVVNNAVLIARDEAICDLYLIVAAALLHDVIDDKLTANPKREHDRLAEALEAIDPAVKEPVFAIIDHLSFSKNLGRPEAVQRRSDRTGCRPAGCDRRDWYCPYLLLRRSCRQCDV